MVEFLPCRDIDEVKSLCTTAQVEYSPLMHAYIAVENGQKVGFGLFELSESCVSILYIPNDDYLADVLVRSAMNYALLMGIEAVNFARANNIELLRGLDFVRGDINSDVPINIFIRNCKNCSNPQGKSC